MTPSLIATILWVIVISGVGMLPMRFHKRFGFPMLAVFPFVLGYLAYDTGVWWAVGLFVAGLSIFRYPVRYFARLAWRRVFGGGALD